MTKTPYIIWTLQRTGGTNFARWLDRRLLNNPPTIHEPFMPTREFGQVTRAFLSNQNSQLLLESVNLLLNQVPIVKHCVETAPWIVTQIFANASVLRGYKHIFLYRRQAHQRLLSYLFSRLTGIWGPKTARYAELKSILTETPEQSALIMKLKQIQIPSEALLKRERECVAMMQALWDFLSSNGDTFALSYEDIYTATSDDCPLEVLKFLGHGTKLESNNHLKVELLSNGEQGTKDLYRHFRGYENFVLGCEGLPQFTPVKAVVE